VRIKARKSLPELAIMGCRGRVSGSDDGASRTACGTARVTDRADLIRAIALLTWRHWVAPIVALTRRHHPTATALHLALSSSSALPLGTVAFIACA
jgi:hypothetical protein